MFDMTTPRIEEILNSIGEEHFALISSKKAVIKALTEAHQAGIDEAVEKIKSLQRWADTDGGEAGMRAEDYGGWLDRDEVLEALQDNK